MRVRWEVEDGYVGKSRPQETYINDIELELCETKEEKEKYINERIQEDFEQKITWARP